MTSQEEKDGTLYSQPQRNFESPFLGEEFFVKEFEAEWEARLVALEAVNSFRQAFEQGWTNLIASEEAKEKFIDQDVRPYSEREEESEVEWEARLTALEKENPFRQAFEQGWTNLIVPEETEEEFVDEDVRPYLEPEEEEAVYSLEGLTDEEEEQTDREEFVIEPEELYPTAETSYTIQKTGVKVKFPSGESLDVVTGPPEGEDQEFWDPTNSGNPLLDTGEQQKNKKLSRNFMVREFTKAGGVSMNVARIDPELVENLQRLRDHVNKPIIIMTGYRSWTYNKKVRGNKKSQHCGGRAADIKIKDMSPLDVAKAAIDACGPNIGIGISNDFVHIDVRGYAAAWDDKKTPASWLNEIKDYQRKKGGSRTPAEMIQFAQCVLNVAENAGLTEDGILESRTQEALNKFRKIYELGPEPVVDGKPVVLDDKIQLALAQRALEVLTQRSIFKKKGERDAATNEAISKFKIQRGLGAEPTLNAKTRAALVDALKQHASAVDASTPVVTPTPVAEFLKNEPRFQTVPLKSKSTIVSHSDWSCSHPGLVCTYNRLGGLMEELATKLTIQPPAVLAVWFVESGGRTHTPGQAIIRFENHLLFRLWGRNNEQIYNQYFRHGGHNNQPGKAWQNHQYRETENQPFRLVHTGKQKDEYAAFNLAKRLAGETIALQCISIGGPQILIQNYQLLGYKTPREMYDAFQASERWHVLGFFDFCRTKRAPKRGQLIEYLRNRNWRDFAYYYNGPGQVSKYSEKISNAYQQACALPLPISHELEFV